MKKAYVFDGTHWIVWVYFSSSGFSISLPVLLMHIQQFCFSGQSVVQLLPRDGLIYSSCNAFASSPNRTFRSFESVCGKRFSEEFEVFILEMLKQDALSQYFTVTVLYITTDVNVN
jgi:hypothetical protein